MIRLFIILALTATPASAQWTCDAAKYCRYMENCAEAVFQFRQCGAWKRDADRDGIPCESICGKTKAVMNQRLAAQGGASGSASFVVPQTAAAFSCSPRKTCGAMASCEEARYHLKTCKNRRLDSDRDGIPCVSLCRGR